MPCPRCNGTCVSDQVDDRVDAQGQLRLGAWRWASRCPTCSTMLYEPAEGPGFRHISPHESDAGVQMCDPTT